MVTFLDNTIYTNYALNKISRNIAGDFENFNFLTIKIGSGDNSLDTSRTDLSTLLYSLKINSRSFILYVACVLFHYFWCVHTTG